MKELVTIIKRKPSKAGDDYNFRIPRDEIKSGIIDPAKKYILEIYEVII